MNTLAHFFAWLGCVLAVSAFVMCAILLSRERHRTPPRFNPENVPAQPRET